MRLTKWDKETRKCGRFEVNYVGCFNFYEVRGPGNAAMKNFPFTIKGRQEALSYATAANNGYGLALIEMLKEVA